MKTWITYLAAIGMGFAANLLLGDIQLFNALIGPVASVLLNSTKPSNT